MAARKSKGVTLRSTKREIWAEKEEIEQLLEEKKVKVRVLEEEIAGLEKETARLRRENEFALRLKAELSALNEKYDLLNRMTRELSALEPDRIFEVCITKIPYLLRARYASVYLYDAEKEKLILKKHSHKRHLDHVVDVNEKPDSLMVQVLREGEVRVIGDIGSYEEERDVDVARRFADYYMTSSCIIAPLKSSDRVLGVLNLADRLDGKTFSLKEDLPLIEKVADLLAISIRNSQLFEQVERQARTDPLTDLTNHQGFFDEFRREMDRADRYGADLALVLLDIDGFKALNDNHGHLAGDYVLEEIARLVRGQVRPSDLAARYGGDEFALLLTEQDRQKALQAAERLRDRIEERDYVFEGAALEVHVSMGIADTELGATSTEVARAADRALDEAKESGEPVVIAG